MVPEMSRCLCPRMAGPNPRLRADDAQSGNDPLGRITLKPYSCGLHPLRVARPVILHYRNLPGASEQEPDVKLGTPRVGLDDCLSMTGPCSSVSPRSN